jgi:hypothetical protein
MASAPEHYRGSTPALALNFTAHQLPVFDASKTEGRIQKTGFRSNSKPGRRIPAVGLNDATKN